MVERVGGVSAHQLPRLLPPLEEMLQEALCGAQHSVDLMARHIDGEQHGADKADVKHDLNDSCDG